MAGRTRPVRIPADTIPDIKDFLKTPYARKLGIFSINDFATRAVIGALTAYKQEYRTLERIFFHIPENNHRR